MVDSPIVVSLALDEKKNPIRSRHHFGALLTSGTLLDEPQPDHLNAAMRRRVYGGDEIERDEQWI